jgi:hypothetical protein
MPSMSIGWLDGGMWRRDVVGHAVVINVTIPQTWPDPRTDIVVMLYPSSSSDFGSSKRSVGVELAYVSTTDSVALYQLTSTVSDLFIHGRPSIKDLGLAALYLWNVSATWTEKIQPAITVRRTVDVLWDRAMAQSNGFTMLMQRYGMTDGGVSLTTDTRILYATIQASQFTLNFASGTATLTVVFRTQPVVPSMYIPVGAISIESFAGMIVNVSSPVIVTGALSNQQTWRVDVLFYICDYGSANSFVVRVRLGAINTRSRSLSDPTYIPISLTGINDGICTAPTTQSGITGLQTAHVMSASDGGNELTNPPVSAFWLQDTINMRVDWTSDTGLDISAVEIYGVAITSDALQSAVVGSYSDNMLQMMDSLQRDAAPLVSIVFQRNFTDGTLLTNTTAYKFHEESADVCGPSSACYSFAASSAVFTTPTNVGFSAQITTVCKITYSVEGAKRTTKVVFNSEVAASSSTVRLFTQRIASSAISIAITPVVALISVIMWLMQN